MNNADKTVTRVCFLCCVMTSAIKRGPFDMVTFEREREGASGGRQTDRQTDNKRGR